MITNPMKAAVVIAYINIESAIALPSQSLFKNIYGGQSVIFFEIYIRNTKNLCNYYQGII